MKKKSFKELTIELQFFGVDNSKEKTIEDIREECRKYIRDCGYECADENYDADASVSELIKEMHPSRNTERFDWTRINYQPLEFLCEDPYSGDLMFAEMNIDFYGDYKRGRGVFNITD